MNKAIMQYIRENLPRTIRESKKNEGTLVALPFPYTVPCAGDMFQELYYWDTYFTNIGLLALGETKLAKQNADNMLYLVDTYGFMPNGNRTYYLNRSQPPFLSFMVRDIYEATEDIVWLSSAYETLCKEYTFWQTKRRLSCGLNGYTGYTIQAEDLDMIYDHFVLRTGYSPSPMPSQTLKREIFMATFSFFESGWDCNSRFLTDGHRVAAVDLNSLLYGMECCMARFAEALGKDPACWFARAEERKALMKQWLWDETTGCYRDYNTRTERFCDYRSAAELYPLFVGLARPAETAGAKVLLERLMLPFGVSAGVERPPWNCQWDHPNVWAPLQWIAYRAMEQYGYEQEAQAVGHTFTDLVERVFEKTGNFWEKYNGLTGDVAVDEYDAPPMMGWTAGVYCAIKAAFHKKT